jgi:dienelactone hydrolase
MRLARAIVVSVLLGAALACRGVASPAPMLSDGYFENAGVRLRFRIDRPGPEAGPGPHPAVVIGHGSGRLTRDDQPWFSWEWTRRGFVVLRYDKRGVGESSGEYVGIGPRNSERMFALLASDMSAATMLLRNQPDVDAGRVLLMGASQAGWIIPVAAERVHPWGMVIISGPTVSVGEEIYYSDFAETGATTLDRAYAELSTFTGARGFDPAPLLASLDVPGLWLLGEADESIPERNTAAILVRLRAGGRPFEFVEYPGADHSLMVNGATVRYWDDVDRWLARLPHGG